MGLVHIKLLAAGKIAKILVAAALKEQISQMQAKDVDAEGAKEEPEEAKEAEAEEAPAEEPEEN